MGIAIILGCREEYPIHRVMEKDLTFHLYVEAAVRFESLRNQGMLPGFAKNDHGSVSSAPFEAGATPWKGYPAEALLEAKKKDHEDVTYYYVFRKASANSQCELVQAWMRYYGSTNRTDLDLKARSPLLRL